MDQERERERERGGERERERERESMREFFVGCFLFLGRIGVVVLEAVSGTQTICQNRRL